MSLLLAAAALPAGFGLAELTGVRPLGGMLLVVLAVLAVRTARLPVPRAAAWYIVVVAAFGASHPLGRAIGAWPAVLVATVVVTSAFAGARSAAAVGRFSAPRPRGRRHGA